MTLEQAIDNLNRLAEQLPADTPLYDEFASLVTGFEADSVTLHDPDTGVDTNITAVIVETED